MVSRRVILLLAVLSLGLGAVLPWFDEILTTAAARVEAHPWR